jgi:hypothetical protein
MDKIIRIFNTNGIRYLLIGGQALRLEGMPRFSMDWDFYIPARDTENIEKINRLLADELDMPLEPMGPRGENFVQTYQTAHGIIQFHLGGPGFPPFDEAERRGAEHKTENGTSVKCLSSKDLLACKEAADRPQDQDDIQFLRSKLGA